MALGLLRQQLPRGVRVHGIVTDGGKAPNIIPERAAARVWVRCLDAAELADAVERVRACAEGAARATRHATREREAERGSRRPCAPNLPLADCYRAQLDAARPARERPRAGRTRSVRATSPTSRAWSRPSTRTSRSDRDLQLHTRAFAEATRSRRGEAGLLEAARALALTVLALVEQPALRAAVARAGA